MTTAYVLSGGGSLGAVQVGMLQALSEHGVSPDLLIGTSVGAQRLVFEVAALAQQADIRVVPPLCPLAVGSSDFSHGAELIDRARASTRRWLDQPRSSSEHPEAMLSLHGHQHGLSTSRPRPVTVPVTPPDLAPAPEGANR